MKILKTANYLRLICAGKPRYQGQLQGDEFNQNSVGEHYSDNELVEGKHIKKLHNLFHKGLYAQFEKFVEELRDEGHSDSRINSMVASATRGKI